MLASANFKKPHEISVKCGGSMQNGRPFSVAMENIYVNKFAAVKRPALVDHVMFCRFMTAKSARNLSPGNTAYEFNYVHLPAKKRTR